MKQGGCAGVIRTTRRLRTTAKEEGIVMDYCDMNIIMWGRSRR